MEAETEMEVLEEIINEIAPNSETSIKTANDKSNEIRHNQLPLTRIKNIMKLDPDFQLTSMEAVFLVTKATELFIQSLAKEAFQHTTQAKKKTIQKRDIDYAISSVDALMFLDDALNF